MSTELSANGDVSSEIDPKKTLELFKLAEEMGYAESEARQALTRASYNCELAMQYLMDGADDSETEAHRLRRQLQPLRDCLMGNPALHDYAVAALIKKERTAEALREMLSSNGVGSLESMLESSSDEEESKGAKKA